MPAEWRLRLLPAPNSEIPLSKGETFPPCNVGGGHSANWTLVRRA